MVGPAFILAVRLTGVVELSSLDLQLHHLMHRSVHFSCLRFNQRMYQCFTLSNLSRLFHYDFGRVDSELDNHGYGFHYKFELRNLLVLLIMFTQPPKSKTMA